MKARLPNSAFFPVEITELLVAPNATVKKHQPLLKYKYWNREADGVEDDGTEGKLITKEYYATYESPIAGTVTKFHVKASERLADSATEILEIMEDCDHSVQYGGLCALCGRNIDAEKDYLGYNDADRAPISMSHDDSSLTVSRNEAERLEKNATSLLLKEKRLILVVDLDQTVIHAARDPQIGEILNNPEDPNHDKLTDVHKFVLQEQHRHEIVDCWYYVKLRPGLTQFFEAMSSKFEMHVYTMATKSYAKEIAKILDPTGKYFGDRVLSREESGSLVQKNLARLFPVTTNLVTIIDDRGDVWGWSNNLIRVFPYNFFQGTGDINAGLLPKRHGLMTPDSELKDVKEIKAKEDPPTAPIDVDDKDNELDTLCEHLSMLHSKYFEKYALNPDPKQCPDVGKLLPSLKQPVFDNCVFLFSGLWPMNTPLDSLDIVQWVRSFGAIVVAEFIPAVTHVIGQNGNTLKARQAAGKNIPVVKTVWLFSCLKAWERVDTKPFEFDVPDPIVNEEVEAIDSNEGADEELEFSNPFMQSQVDWAEMDKEIEEYMDSDDEDDDEDDDDDDDDDNHSDSQPAKSDNKRSREDGSDSEHDFKRVRAESSGDEDFDDMAAALELELQG